MPPVTPQLSPLAADAGRVVVLRNPQTLVFGTGCVARCADDVIARGLKRTFIVTGPTTRTLTDGLVDSLRGAGMTVSLFDKIAREPTVEMFRAALSAAR